VDEVPISEFSFFDKNDSDGEIGMPEQVKKLIM
jgi:hypothetical protein